MWTPHSYNPMTTCNIQCRRTKNHPRPHYRAQVCDVAGILPTILFTIVVYYYSHRSTHQIFIYMTFTNLSFGQQYFQANWYKYLYRKPIRSLLWIFALADRMIILLALWRSRLLCGEREHTGIPYLLKPEYGMASLTGWLGTLHQRDG
jgi:hypothetical protein